MFQVIFYATLSLLQNRTVQHYKEDCATLLPMLHYIFVQQQHHVQHLDPPLQHEHNSAALASTTAARAQSCSISIHRYSTSTIVPHQHPWLQLLNQNINRYTHVYRWMFHRYTNTIVYTNSTNTIQDSTIVEMQQYTQYKYTMLVLDMSHDQNYNRR